jgi:hypothetical protein
MATVKQITANRANAQRSTGPRTAQGKAASSQNAMKSGLYSRQLILHSENVDDFNQLLQTLLTAHNPIDDHETILVEQLAQAQWRLNRARVIEVDLLESLVHYGIYRSRPRRKTAVEQMSYEISSSYVKPDNLFRYITRCENVFFRTLEALRRAQRDRALRSTAPDPHVSAGVKPAPDPGVSAGVKPAPDPHVSAGVKPAPDPHVSAGVKTPSNRDRQAAVPSQTHALAWVSEPRTSEPQQRPKRQRGLTNITRQPSGQNSASTSRQAGVEKPSMSMTPERSDGCRTHVPKRTPNAVRGGDPVRKSDSLPASLLE